MSYHLLLLRHTFTEKSSGSDLHINGDYFCHTLEDPSRGRGVKLYGRTCIPEGTYYVDVTMSTRFNREMPIIYNQANGYQLIAGDIEFKGLRFHGGNTHVDTEGCVLVAFNKVNDDTIQGTAESALTERLIKLGRKGFLTIVNKI
jgi:hypothetical protein